MRNELFPTLIVDNFLPNVNEIVEYANQIEFYYDDSGRWPGKRSDPLHLINNDLFLYVGNKILESYNIKDNYAWIAEAGYQLVNDKYFQGWIHTDSNILTSILYLNKKNNLNSGTSLYWPKKFYPEPIHTEVKKNFYKELIKNPQYEMSDYEKKCLIENNDLYYEVLNVKNVFNRLFSFEGDKAHAANNFDNEETRLTLIYFFNEINLKDNNYPLTSYKCPTQHK